MPGTLQRTEQVITVVELREMLDDQDAKSFANVTSMGVAQVRGGAWRVEQDSTSVGAVDTVPGLGGRELGFRYALSTQITPAPFVALTVDTPNGLAANTRLAFTVRADRQMRLSIQFRAPRPDGTAERWQRSVYIDTEDGERTVFLDDLTPISDTRTYRPPLADAHSIVFAIDLTNTKPGASGRFWIRNVVLQK